MDNDLDAMVIGVGSSGTVTGLGQFFHEHHPKCEMIVADPEVSILGQTINEGISLEAGFWLVEGIGEDFMPPICDISLVKKSLFDQ